MNFNIFIISEKDTHMYFNIFIRGEQEKTYTN